MNEKFKDISVEGDVKILMSSPMRWGELDIVYQKWNWDGMMAESIIFVNEDVKGLDDMALENEVRTSPLVSLNSQVTITRGEKFTFVNFNFVT